MRLRNAYVAKQNVIGGLLVFTILIAVSLALGFYGYYMERAPKTTTAPTTSPTTTTTLANITNTATVTTTPTNTTTEVPYTPQ